MEIPQSIIKPLESLLQNQAFIENVAAYTIDGLSSLYGIGDEEGYCPAYYLLALNFMMTNNLEFSSLLRYLPASTHQQYTNALVQVSKRSNKQSDSYTGKELDINSLGVQSLMAIEYGKQFWRVHLHTSDGKIKTLRVEYQSMAMLVLKLSQALHSISSVNVKSLPL